MCEFSGFFWKKKIIFGNSDSFMELQFSMLSLDVGFSMLVLSVQKSSNAFMKYFSKVMRQMKENSVYFFLFFFVFVFFISISMKS